MTAAISSPTILPARSNWLAELTSPFKLHDALTSFVETQQMVRVKTVRRKVLRQITMVNVVLSAADHCTHDYPPAGQGLGP